jgi:hypothetical protein
LQNVTEGTAGSSSDTSVGTHGAEHVVELIARAECSLRPVGGARRRNSDTRSPS